MQKKGSGVEERDLEGVVELFRLLSDKTRLHILMLLSDGEKNVSSLCAELGLPQPTVSHHLGLLRMRNLISNRRNGKQVFYGLNGHVAPGPGSNLKIGGDSYIVHISERT